MMIKTILLSTEKTTEFIDITDQIEEVLKTSKVQNGICVIFIPHTTAGITINENADPAVKRDMVKELNKVIPFEDGYQHMEGNSAAHIKASMMGFSQTVIIENNRMLLGTWQGIYFCEFDGARTRKVCIKMIEG